MVGLCRDGHVVCVMATYYNSVLQLFTTLYSYILRLLTAWRTKCFVLMLPSRTRVFHQLQLLVSVFQYGIQVHKVLSYSTEYTASFIVESKAMDGGLVVKYSWYEIPPPLTENFPWIFSPSKTFMSTGIYTHMLIQVCTPWIDSCTYRIPFCLWQILCPSCQWYTCKKW